MKRNEKIRILLKNNKMYQEDLAKTISVSTSAVQKWVVGKNQTPLDIVDMLHDVFNISYDELLDEEIEIPDYYKNEKFDTPEYYFIDCYRLYSQPDSESEHEIYDVNLGEGTFLHRFTNSGGEKCSAIYFHKKEVLWHYRDHEAELINQWRRMKAIYDR